WTPVAVTRPLQASHCRGLLILVQPAGTGPLAGEDAGMSAADAAALLRWVEKGNTLLLASRTNTRLHQALGVVVLDEEVPRDTFAPARLAAAGAHLEGVERIRLGSRATLRSEGDALLLWRLGEQPAALLVRRGKGRVLLVADPGLLTRRGLVRD